MRLGAGTPHSFPGGAGSLSVVLPAGKLAELHNLLVGYTGMSILSMDVAIMRKSLSLQDFLNCSSIVPFTSREALVLQIFCMLISFSITDARPMGQSSMNNDHTTNFSY